MTEEKKEESEAKSTREKRTEKLQGPRRYVWNAFFHVYKSHDMVRNLTHRHVSQCITKNFTPFLRHESQVCTFTCVHHMIRRFTPCRVFMTSFKCKHVGMCWNAVFLDVDFYYFMPQFCVSKVIMASSCLCGP